MYIQKIARKSYKYSFLNSVQLVIAFPNSERKTRLVSSVFKILEDEGFESNSLSETGLIRADRGSSHLIIANGTILLIVGAKDYVSFENYSNFVSIVKNLLNILDVSEINTLFFQKRNSYPFTKGTFNNVPTKDALYESVFSKEFLEEINTMMLSETENMAYMAQRKYLETDDFYLVESLISAIKMNVIAVDKIECDLADLNDEMFSIWNAVTSEDVKMIMKGE